MSIQTLWGNFCLKKHKLFFRFWILSKKFRLLAGTFSASCRKRVRCVESIILWKTVYSWVKNKFYFFSMFSVRTPFSSRSFFVKVRKTIFNMSEKTYGKNKFESICFHHFLIMSENFFSLCQNVFSGVVKSAFYVSRGKIWGKENAIEKKSCQYLLSIELECLPFLAKRFQQNSQNSILPAHINFVRKYFVVNKKKGEISRRDVKNRCHQQRHTEEVILMFAKVSGFEKICLMQA